MSKKIFRKLINFIKLDFFKPYKSIKKYDLLIFDDIFPHPISGFRLEEFTQLLLQFSNSKIIVSGEAYSVLNSKKSQHIKDIHNFKENHSILQNQIFRKSKFININTNLFYCVFISNIYNNLSWLEKHKIPFVFTLYPGGGFKVDDANCNKKLKKVFDSPQFRKVIVTQKFTQDYLINNSFCSHDKIKFIFGGIVPQVSIFKDLTEKQTYLINKPTLDIAFCAAKYMPKGLDKGYDVFIELAHLLNTKYDFIKFHIIGGFDETDIDVTDLQSNISFYGYQNFEGLTEIFKNIDIIVSPNKPFYLGKGSFDGFPLGTVVEAVLNGSVAMVTDKLNQNTVFENNQEIIIIESNAQEIEKEIIKLINNPEKMYSISKNGILKFNEIYSNKIQMNPRIELIKNEMKNN